MATYTYARRKRSYNYWSRFAAGAVVLFPLSLHNVDFRATFSGLALSAHKSSPAYAAFEDLREDYKPDFETFPEPSLTLAAGPKFEVTPAEQKTHVVRLALRGLTIRAPAKLEPTFLPRVQLVAAHKNPSAVIVQPSSTLAQGTAAPGAENWMESRANAHQLIRDRFFSSQKSATLLKPGLLSSKPPQDVVARAADLSVAAFSSSLLAPFNPDPNQFRPLWLEGQIDLTGGLAFIGPDTQLTVKRVFNGNVFEEGRIWITEGKFEIRVKEPTGYLLAELQTRDGRVLGTGELNLLNLAPPSERADRIADLKVSLHPTSTGASFHAVNGFAGGGQKVAVSDARVEIQSFSEPQHVNEEGLVSDSSFSRESSFVARATAKNNWPTLIVGQAREPQDIRLFSNSLVNALIALNSDRSDRSEALQQSVVWGMLKQDGQPIVNGQVELAGPYTPIYFDEAFLPDAKLTSTSKNGLFAFVNVPTGVQALRTKVAGKLYPAQVFPTEAQHVSYIEFDVRPKVMSQFRVFDGLDLNKNIPANIRLVGTDETLPVAQDQLVEYGVAANPFMVEAEGSADYEVSRATVTGSPHVVNIPMISKSWLYQLLLAKKFFARPGRGTVVGFVDEPNFEIEMTGYAPREQIDIVYFDAQGNPLESKTGVMGGGFAIFNAPAGLQTVYVHSAQSSETFSQVVVAESGYVQVLTH